MSNPWHRPVLAALAAGLLLAGVITVSLGRGGTSANAAGTVTIEILDSGFNPQVCQVNRSGIPGVPLYDSGDIALGDTTTGGVIVNQIWDQQYYEEYEKTMTGRIVSPLSPSAQTSCSPQPPTPTPTPTRTPTPIAPTPAPLQLHPRCIGLQGCAVLPVVAGDD
jgi:hypothetical protein